MEIKRRATLNHYNNSRISSKCQLNFHTFNPMLFLPANIIRKLDAEAIASGISGEILMENAGYGAFRFLQNIAAPNANSFLIFAGKGNNAGDAFVVARHLIQSKKYVEIICLAELDQYKGDAKTNLEKLINLSPNISVITNEDSLNNFYRRCDVIIDGLLGTGIRGNISGIFKTAIEKINSLRAPVFSLDIPSGLDCDTGEIHGCAVKAKWTATFANPKLAFLTENGAKFAGRVEVINIGIPPAIKNNFAHNSTGFQSTFFVDCNQQNMSIAHKNTFGHLLVIAGRLGMTGAAALAAKAAVSSGCGLVTLAVPKSLLALVAPAVPSVMTLPLADAGAGFFTKKSADKIIENINKFDAVALGPGIGTNPETADFIKKILPALAKKKIVIDADALNIIADNKKLLDLLNENSVITPHPGEFQRIADERPDKSDTARIAAAKKFSANHKFTLLLKGFHTIIAKPNAKNIYINLTGNYGMATAGSGDVLTGILGARLARGCDAEAAAVSAAYIHGLAGDIAAANLSYEPVTAEQIINFLGKAYYSIKKF